MDIFICWDKITPPPLHLFQAELRKLEKTSEDVEMITAIAKREVSVATEGVITKMQQQEKQLIESLEMTRRRRKKANQLG